MPRFGVRTLLITTAVAALWLSTLTGYSAGPDVRKSILLLILVAAGCAAIYARGQRRAFWGGFFVVMLLCGGTELQRPLHRYVPDFAWLTSLAPAQTAVYSYYQPSQLRDGARTVVMPAPVSPTPFPAAPPQPIWIAVIGTAWILILSVLGGFVAAYIYRQTGTSTPVVTAAD